jgi:hypothetical protein
MSHPELPLEYRTTTLATWTHMRRSHMADNPEVNDLLKRLREIVVSYSGPGVAFEETEIDAKRSSDFWQTVAQLEHLGVSKSDIGRSAGFSIERKPPRR